MIELLAKRFPELSIASPQEITRRAISHAQGAAIVSTNFGPYEAVVLHMCVQVQPDIPVLWVDHGYNRLATYRYAHQLTELLKLNVQGFIPKITAAHRDALYGPLPALDDEAGLKEFSALMKLEPFQRGLRELKAKVWITGLRKVQNPNRAGLGVVLQDEFFNTLKVNPVFHLSDAEMEEYLKRHDLPNEWDYFDPAKASEKRECGLHADWGAQAVKPSPLQPAKL
jgi:phosphoadenosine phosphosulfate reductase